MRAFTLLERSLAYYWRTNGAVVLGVATAAAVLSGSLLVGDSVRASLARIALGRLGSVTHAVESPGFFREALAGDLKARPAFSAGFRGACPMLALRGVVTHAASRRRADAVLVYGVDARFWELQGLSTPGPVGRAALLSPALAAELQSQAGEALLVGLDAAADVPGSTLFGRRDEPSRRLRVAAQGVLARRELGEFSLTPRPDDVRAAFLPLSLLQDAIGQPGRVNTILLAARDAAAGEGRLEALLRETARLEDRGLRLRLLPRGALQLEATSGLLGDGPLRAAESVAARQGLEGTAVLVYLANALRAGPRSTPYSLVAAVDARAFAKLAGRSLNPAPDGPLPMVINDWTASDLGVSEGAALSLDYYLWEEDGRLQTRSVEGRVAAVVPMTGLAADREIVPEYPGITQSLHLADWDPPFHVDLARIRPKDEAYWDRHRTTPKAFVPLAMGQRLWGHRLGRLTTLRLAPGAGVDPALARERFAAALAEQLGAGGFALGGGARAVAPLKAAALRAARGSTDFGEYFVYFSCFLVAAALLLAALFFRLGVEQRLAEIGLLRSLGFSASRLRLGFLGEGLLLAGAGGLLGMLGGAGYAALLLWALRQLWADALGTRELDLELTLPPLLMGALGAVAAGSLAIGWALSDLSRRSPRSLLSGSLGEWTERPLRRRYFLPAALTAVALLLVAGSRTGTPSPTAGFFGAGGLLLGAALCLARVVLLGRPRAENALGGVFSLGVRAASYRPGRSVLCIALVAAATFVVVAVGAFRRDALAEDLARDGESGGYPLFAWSLVPLHHDLATAEGQSALALEAAPLEGVRVARFRARLGEDASCLNLYEPRRPTVLAPTASFLRERRFAFEASLARTPEERANPWLLLERGRQDGAFPVIADASSLAYVLHKRLGDVMPLAETGVKVRFVAALAPGLFQGELLMGERDFLEAFPETSGYRFFLLELARERALPVRDYLEQQLADFGFDVSDSASRLRAFHRVEGTYIATFQALGALGLLLGTLGLATVLIRNALERRRELALLRALGFRPAQLSRMVLAENAVLLGFGFLGGALPALVAIGPVLLERRGGFPLALLALVAFAISLTGGLVSWLGVSVVRRLPLLASLHSE